MNTREHRTDLSWLLRLRFGAIASETILVLAVNDATIRLPVLRLFAIFGVALASNVALFLWSRQAPAISEHVIGGVLVVDVVALTVALAITGGPLNPFSSLYLVYIALAAVVLGVRWTWALVLLGGAAYAALFAVSAESLWGPDHATHMRIHLKGMWLAFSVAALFIGYFVQRIRRALSERDAELVAVRARQARSEKLAALATLAAGAAHELSTPLSTIAVIARELEADLAKADSTGALLEDARLIRAEVTRCRAVLDQLSADVGSGVGEAPREITPRELLDLASAGLAERPPIEIAIDEQASGLCVRVAARPLALAIRSLVENAQHASSVDDVVRVRVATPKQRLEVDIVDRGSGMPAEVLARVGEPFFTTKEPGHGMGLGVFLARSIVEQLDGDLTIDSRAGGGTTVRLTVPVSSSASANS